MEWFIIIPFMFLLFALNMRIYLAMFAAILGYFVFFQQIPIQIAVQRLIALARAAGIDGPIAIHGALQRLCDYHIEQGIALGALIPATAEDVPAHLVIAPPSALAYSSPSFFSWHLKPKSSSTVPTKMHIRPIVIERRHSPCSQLWSPQCITLVPTKR